MKPMKPFKPFSNSLFIWIVIFVAVFVLANIFKAPLDISKYQKLSFTDFVTQIKNGEVVAVSMNQQEVSGTLKNGVKFVSYIPTDSGIVPLLQEKGVSLTVVPEDKGSASLVGWLPLIGFLVVWLLMMRHMSSTNGKALNFGKSKARLMAEKGKVTFADVAGIDEARQELEEIVDFLKSPLKFQRLGGKIPKGVLMIGPPGTGKTLLARAIAGEAKVPFFTISGSDFVEMFVGVGASRVRDMFEQAKKNSPCIVFVDEIDAVGRHRGAGLGGGNDEREQTLNQLLVEMDGFEPNSGIILIAATNRPDVLDPALLRPGRFDRQIVVSNPDVKGREDILKVHVKKVPLASDVDLSILARGTPGFSGADLANLINEGALLAARRNQLKVRMLDLEDAKDKVLMGTERKSLVMDDDEKRMTAYHEAGHAIVSLFMPESDPIHKVTIIPRGRALGITMQLPEKDKYSQTKTYLKSRLSILFGGRIAEEMILGPDKVSTGASNDIQVATSIARKMVSEWGMSSLGPIAFEEPKEEVFLGYDISKRKHMADKTALAVDEEIKEILHTAYKTAEEILKKNKAKLDLLAEGLVENETLTGEEVLKIVSGKKIKSEKKEKTLSKVRETVPNVKKSQRGRTLLEMIGVICIIGVLTVGVFNSIGYAMLMVRVHKAKTDVEELALGIQDLYSWAGTYKDFSASDLCENDILQDECLKYIDTKNQAEVYYWPGAWGGMLLAVSNESDTSSIDIQYTGVPKEACMKLLEEKYKYVTIETPKLCDKEDDNMFVFKLNGNNER